jgi:hypothetical protein
MTKPRTAKSNATQKGNTSSGSLGDQRRYGWTYDDRTMQASEVYTKKLGFPNRNLENLCFLAVGENKSLSILVLRQLLYLGCWMSLIQGPLSSAQIPQYFEQDYQNDSEMSIRDALRL